VERLEEVFEGLGVSPRGKKCKAMEGLIAEGEERIAEEEADPDVRDAALIAAAQRVEHYEIAGYGCVRTFAGLLGYEESAALLQKTLDEEAEADEKLTDLAETVINVKAAEEEDTEAEDAEEEKPRTAPAPKKAAPKKKSTGKAKG